MSREALSVHEGKHLLQTVALKGSPLKACQGRSDRLACCELKTISPVQNCPYDCSYCFLQFYLNHGVTKIARDLTPIKEALLRLSRNEPDKIHRVTTGELSDSLALERLTGHAQELIPFVESLPNIVLELKTKSDAVAPLLRFQPTKTIVSFSLSPKTLSCEEQRAAPVWRRIEAAFQLQQKGYRLAFHFDPILCFPGWEEEYAQLIEELFTRIDAESIVYLSLGSLRFQPELLKALYFQNPHSILFAQELFPEDGKWRYPLFLRKKLYRTVIRFIRNFDKGARIYLCMEPRKAWEGVLDFVPQSHEELEAYLIAPFQSLLEKPRHNNL